MDFRVKLKMLMLRKQLQNSASYENILAAPNQVL